MPKFKIKEYFSQKKNSITKKHYTLYKHKISEFLYTMPHPSPASIPLFHSPVPSTPPCNILWSLSKFETLIFFLETKPTCPNLKFKLPLLRAGRFRLKKNNIYKLSYFFSLTSYFLPLTLTHPTRTKKKARTNCKHANRRRDGRRPKRNHHGRRVRR